MNFKSFLYTRYLLVILIIIFNSCSDDPENPVFERDKLISYEELTDFTQSEIDSKYNLTVAEYDVDIYKLVYKSTYKEQEVELTGIILVPASNQPLPFLNYNHATIFANEDAPSRLGEGLEAGDLFASTGFITVMPDYPGFGDPPLFPPPYLVAEAYVAPAVDMLVAAQEFCQEQGITTVPELYLCGYSEGGLATASVSRSLEQNNPTGLVLNGISIGGAPLDPADNLNFYLGLENLSSFQVLVLARILAANVDYFETLDYSEVFQSPYDQIIANGLFNPENSLFEVSQQLPANIEELLLESFVTRLMDTSSDVWQTINKSSLMDWDPVTIVQVTHGTDDQIVPITNSINFLAQSNGGMVSLLQIPGGGHEFTAQLWALNTLANVLQVE